MDGQMTIFDLQKSEKLRPCDYRFQRYFGQRVGVNCTSGKRTGRIVEIEHYYTIIREDRTGQLIAGTPTNTYPLEGGK